MSYRDFSKGFGPLIKRVSDYLRIRPELKESIAPANYRQPTPGSEAHGPYKAPKSAASNIANNYYYSRDTRRAYPKTVVGTNPTAPAAIAGAGAPALVAGATAEPVAQALKLSYDLPPTPGARVYSAKVQFPVLEDIYKRSETIPWPLPPETYRRAEPAYEGDARAEKLSKEYAADMENRYPFYPPWKLREMQAAKAK